MPELRWTPDSRFVQIAQKLPLKSFEHNAMQYGGSEIDMDANRRRLLLNSNCDSTINTSPNSIIQSAIDQDWLLFVLKVGLWGNMIPGRSASRKIYNCEYRDQPDPNRLRAISSAMEMAFKQFQTENDLSNIWNDLGNTLNWSKVMRSKCLHFLARSAGLGENVPVAVDTAMAVKWMWVALKGQAEQKKIRWPRPGRISQDDFDSYNRYLSVIHGWSQALGISMLQCEVNLFASFRSNLAMAELFEGS